MLNFSIPQARSRWLVASRLSPLLERIFHYPAVLGIIGFRLGAAVLLLSGVCSGLPESALCGLVATTSIALSLRTPFGNDGADQMTILIFSALTLARFADTPEAGAISLWFLALQTCLSYFTAGVAKASSRVWRNGEAITGIFRTVVYGHSSIARTIGRHPVSAIIAGWSVIVTECSFVFALISPQPIVFAFLFGGLLFHIMSAIFMGLNTFL